MGIGKSLGYGIGDWKSLGYVSCTNHITAFGYLAPITAFGYCLLVNDVKDQWGCAQRMTLTRYFGLVC